ncbi:MAG: VOC family protein [Leifsonia sp.]
MEDLDDGEGPEMVIVNDERRYPEGVPSWIDVETDDPAAAARFYGALFGWEVHEAMPPGAPGSYLIATLDGHDVAAIAPVTGGAAARWNTYVACDDADRTAAAVQAAGGRVLSGPEDAGPGGRLAVCADPGGALFRLWQARRRLGAQLVNEPGTWNFSVLLTAHPGEILPFYREVFRWEVDPGLGAGMVRLPGYGDHLAATIDPDIRERQAFAPPGFADVVAGVERADVPAHWEVRFTVDDRDAAVALAVENGATVVRTDDGEWTKEALLRDPQGAEFTVSQFSPSA